MKTKINRRSFLAWFWFTIMLTVSIATLMGKFGNQTVKGTIWEQLDIVLSLLISIAFPLIGALIISRQPQNIIGWLLMIPSLAILLDPIIQNQIANTIAPPAQPSILFWIAIYFCNATWAFAIFPIFLIALLFPTGKPLSSKWRWIVAYAVSLFVLIFGIASFNKTLAPDHTLYGVDWSITNPIGFLEPSTNDFLINIWLVAMIVLVLLCIVSFTLRFRRAGSTEREQMKWLLTAVIMFGINYSILSLLQSRGFAFLSILNTLFMLTIPIAIGIAILRYRLWNIDLIIRKTLQYILLTGLLALVYSGSVILLQTLTENLIGKQSPLVIVLSTLVIAALFNPLRIRIQNFIDSRFFRQKYDAQKILAQFAQSAREEVEIEVLQNELLQVIQETIQPEIVNLWLKKIVLRTNHEG